jgi:hypothetical protein
MNRLLKTVGAVGAGAALMYFLDPDRGKTRRELVRDRAVGLSKDVQSAIGKRTRELKDRAHGVLHDARAAFAGNGSETAAPNDSVQELGH